MSRLNQYLISFIEIVQWMTVHSGFYFIASSFCLTASRLIQMLVFLIPLKIFIILSLGKNPNYLAKIFHNLSFQEEIYLLASLIPLLYLIQILVGSLHRQSLDKHVKFLANQTLLIGSKAINNKVLNRVQNYTIKAFSDIVLFAVSILFILILSPILSLTIIVTTYLALLLVFHYALTAADSLRVSFLKLHPRQIIEYTHSALFLIVFLMILLLKIKSLINESHAIILLFVSRMVCQAFNRFTGESMNLLKVIPKESL